MLPIINFFRYNVIMDFPLTMDINRLKTGGPYVFSSLRSSKTLFSIIHSSNTASPGSNIFVLVDI